MTGPDEETGAQRELLNVSTDIMPKKADIVTGDCNYGMISYDGSGRIHASGINSRAAPHLIVPPWNGRGGVRRYDTSDVAILTGSIKRGLHG